MHFNYFSNNTDVRNSSLPFVQMKNTCLQVPKLTEVISFCFGLN